MKLMKCVNSHFYDGDIYSQCPHCQNASDDPKTEKINRSALDRESKNDKIAEEFIWASPEQNNDSPNHKDMEGGVQKEQEYVQNDLEREINDLNVTEKLSIPHDKSEYDEPRYPEHKAHSMAHEIPDDEGRTVRFSSRKEDAKEPLVGWLVGLNGEVYGEGFPLVTGRNYIGRGADMDVVLRGDPSISRNKHAIIIYEPKSRQFLLQPGESKELFYMDNKVVLDTQVMSNGCELCIGETKLKFIAFCGEDFSWETNS